MKEEVRVSAVQFATEWLNLEKNVKRMAEFVEREAKDGQELIVFPEAANIGEITPRWPGDPVGAEGMTVTQFATAYVRAAEPIPGPTTETISGLTRRYGVYVVVGMAQKHPTIPATLFNAAVLIGPQGIIGVQHKIHLPLLEKVYFCQGNESEVFRTELGNIGMEICYDIRFPEVSRILALKGAEIICCGHASYAKVAPDKYTHYHRTFVRAEENGVYFITVNGSGQQGEVHLTGHSAIAAPNGELLAVSDTDQEEVIRAVLSNEGLVSYRSIRNNLRDRRPELYQLLCTPLSEQPELAPNLKPDTVKPKNKKGKDR